MHFIMLTCNVGYGTAKLYLLYLQIYSGVVGISSAEEFMNVWIYEFQIKVEVKLGFAWECMYLYGSRFFVKVNSLWYVWNEVNGFALLGQESLNSCFHNTGMSWWSTWSETLSQSANGDLILYYYYLMAFLSFFVAANFMLDLLYLWIWNWTGSRRGAHPKILLRIRRHVGIITVWMPFVSALFYL